MAQFNKIVILVYTQRDGNNQIQLTLEDNVKIDLKEIRLYVVE